MLAILPKAVVTVTLIALSASWPRTGLRFPDPQISLRFEFASSPQHRTGLFSFQPSTLKSTRVAQVDEMGNGTLVVKI